MVKSDIVRFTKTAQLGIAQIAVSGGISGLLQLCTMLSSKINSVMTAQAPSLIYRCYLQIVLAVPAVTLGDMVIHLDAGFYRYS